MQRQFTYLGDDRSTPVLVLHTTPKQKEAASSSGLDAHANGVESYDFVMDIFEVMNFEAFRNTGLKLESSHRVSAGLFSWIRLDPTFQHLSPSTDMVLCAPAAH